MSWRKRKTERKQNYKIYFNEYESFSDIQDSELIGRNFLIELSKIRTPA